VEAHRVVRVGFVMDEVALRWILSLEVKLPGHEADQSLLSCAGVKKGGSIPPLPHFFMALCLIN
jgi:hypothetical protein